LEDSFWFKGQKREAEGIQHFSQAKTQTKQRSLTNKGGEARLREREKCDLRIRNATGRRSPKEWFWIDWQEGTKSAREG